MPPIGRNNPGINGFGFNPLRPNSHQAFKRVVGEIEDLAEDAQFRVINKNPQAKKENPNQNWENNSNAKVYFMNKVVAGQNFASSFKFDQIKNKDLGLA